jgi:uncharacterized repeat protein (TIGR01451 family)
VDCYLGDLAVGEFREVFLRFAVDPAIPDGTVLNNTVTVNADSPINVTGDLTETTTVRSVTGLSITKTASNSSPLPGEVFKYMISVHNAGPSTAFNVVVIDVLPNMITYIDDTLNPSCVVAGQTLTCALGDIQPGETVSFEIAVMLDENAISGELLTNTAIISGTFLSDEATVIVDGGADLRVAKFVKPDGHVYAGVPFVYTIFVDNLGPSPAYTLTLTDEMLGSADFTVLSAAASAGTCDLVAPATGTAVTFSCTGAVLDVYGRWTIHVTAIASDTVDVNNEVRVMAADPVDPDTSNNFDSASISVHAVADLSISKSATVTEAVAGTSYVYTLSVSNAGPSEAKAVVVQDVLPLGLHVHGPVSVPTGASCGLTQLAEGNLVITCNLGNMAVGASAEIAIPVMVDPAANPIETVNTATVSSSTADRDNSNNQAWTVVDILSEAVLEIEKTSYAPNGVIAGELIEYTISVFNSGPSTAKAVGVTDELPFGLHIISVNVPSQPGAECSVRTTPPEFIDCNLGDIMPGEAEVIVVTAMVDVNVPDGTVITNTAESFASNAIVVESDPVTDTVAAIANIAVDKTASASNPSTGEVFYYLVRVSNDGPSTAQAVMVTDTLPSGVTFKWAEGALCSEVSAGVVVCDLNAIEPGDAKEVKLYVQVNVDVPDNTTLLNSVVATTSTSGNSPVSDDASVVVNTLADLAIRKFGKPDGEVWAGAPLVYTVIVDNFGPGVAHDVVVTDLMASSGTFTFSAPGCTPSNGTATGSQQLSCALGNMMPGEQRILTMTVTAEQPQSMNNVADVSGADEDPDMNNNHAKVEHQIDALGDLSVEKTAPVTVTSGSTMQYSILVSNGGPSTAVNVEVIDHLPAGLTVLSVTPSQGNCPQVGATVKCSLGNLASGASATVVIDVSVNANLPHGTNLINGVTVTSATYDNDTADNSDTTSTTVLANLLLDVVKKANKSLAVPGDTVDWMITVKNVGVSAQYDIMLVDTLPTGFTFVTGDSIPTGKVSCSDLFAPQVNCVIDSLQPGKQVVVFIRTSVDSDITPGVKVNSVTADNLSATSQVTASVNVTIVTDLHLTAQADPISALTGEAVVLTYRATNRGPAVANDVRLTVSLPAGLIYLADTLNSPVLAAVAAGVSGLDAVDAACGSALTNCSLGNLKPGQSAEFKVYVQVADTAVCEKVMKAPGQVSAVTPETNLANNVAEPVVFTDCSADLSITKDAKPDGVIMAGGEIRYTLDVYNFGPSTAYSVTVTDHMMSDVGRQSKGTFQILAINPNLSGNFPDAKCTPAAPITVTDYDETVVCTPGRPMAAGENWQILITVKSNDALDINNVARVGSVTPDPDTSNNVDRKERSIACLSDQSVDLTINKSALNAQVVPGGIAIFKIDYANLTNIDAACVTIIEEVPDLSVFNVANSTPTWSCIDGAPAGTRCVYDVGPVKAGETGSLNFAVKVSSSVGETTCVTNTATIRTPGEEATDNNTDSAEVCIVPPTNDPDAPEPASPDQTRRTFLPVITR